MSAEAWEELRREIESLPLYHLGNDDTPQVVERAAVLAIVGRLAAATPVADTAGIDAACPVCGSPVRVVSSDEGTSYYAPDPGAMRTQPTHEGMVLVHADGGDCHGTPLVNWRCPKCGIAPDMQSTEFWPTPEPDQ